MSLRDQLVAAGVVSKKDAKRVDRQLKQERKAEQASRKRKSELEAEARARAEREAAEQLDRRRAERQAADARREAIERPLRIRNLIAGNTLRPGSGQPFWHRSLDGAQLLRLDVSSGTAWQLRCGEAAIAALPRASASSGGWIDYVVISASAAAKLREIAPEHVVFLVEDATGLSAPDLAFYRRQWDSSLSARRARPEDLDPRRWLG